MRRIIHSVLAAPLALAACATPPSGSTPPPTAAMPTAATSAAAPGRVCRVEGLRFTRESMVSPTMTVSRDGSCSGGVSTSGNSNNRSLAIRSQPAHGTLAVDLSNPVRPTYRYTPAQGYVGRDEFTMVYTANTGVQIDMTVNVVP